MENHMDFIEVTTDHNELGRSSLGLGKAERLTRKEDSLLREPPRGARAAGDNSTALFREKPVHESRALRMKSSKPTRENLPRAAKTKGNIFIKKAISVLGLNKYDRKPTRSKSINMQRRKARTAGMATGSRAKSTSYCSVCFSNMHKTKICSSCGQHFG
ncbi:hypothetical protein EVAR_65003_1 [Eumeta japonica]|uniref:Uncharacterized protein n=1 Tax=Eumeta variegata TaxID=151549 RepID=A0A4C1S835_EUMVA|nr:hypothetical protein EVAR_65003_1 [Eumeta japonica]